MICNKMDLIKGILTSETYTLTYLLELYRFYSVRVAKTNTSCGPGVHCTVQKVPAHWYYLV